MADARHITRRSVLKTATAIGLAGSGLTAAAAMEAEHPDLPLLVLGERLEMESQAYDLVLAKFAGVDTHEADEACTYACGEVSVIVRNIASLQARTVDGLRVKARAIQWCFGNEPIMFDEGEASSNKLAAQIVQALLEA